MTYPLFPTSNGIAVAMLFRFVFSSRTFVSHECSFFRVPGRPYSYVCKLNSTRAAFVWPVWAPTASMYIQVPGMYLLLFD